LPLAYLRVEKPVFRFPTTHAGSFGNRIKTIPCVDIPGEAAGDNLVTIMINLGRIIVFAVQLTWANCILAHLLHHLLQREGQSNIFWDLNTGTGNIFPKNKNIFPVMGINYLILLLHGIKEN